MKIIKSNRWSKIAINFVDSNKEFISFTAKDGSKLYICTKR